MTARALVVAALAALAALSFAACSGSNREGPLVTCEDLECGRINACEEGIIAGCVDGVVRYHVCSTTNDPDICAGSWQTPGAFRCDQNALDCEGCNPLLPACGGGSGGSGGGG